MKFFLRETQKQMTIKIKDSNGFWQQYDDFIWQYDGTFGIRLDEFYNAALDYDADTIIPIIDTEAEFNDLVAKVKEDYKDYTVKVYFDGFVPLLSAADITDDVHFIAKLEPHRDCDGNIDDLFYNEYFY